MIRGLLVAIVLAGGVPGQEKTRNDAEDIARVLESVRDHVARRDKKLLTAIWDLDAMEQAVKSALSYDEGEVALKRIRATVKLILRLTYLVGEDVSWPAQEVRSVQVSKDGTRATAWVRMRNAEGTRYASRWYLVRRDGRWRPYDTEDVEDGAFLSTTIAASISGYTGRGERRRVFRRFVLVWERVYDGRLDGEAALRALGAIDAEKLPPAFTTLHAFSVANALYQADREEEALAAVEKALALEPNLPWLHVLASKCLNALERHAEALQRIEKWAAVAGRDADYWSEVGDAHDGLDQPEKARAAYRKALDDDAGSHYDLFSLILALDDDRKSKALPYLEKLPDPDRALPWIARQLHVSEDAKGLRLLVKFRQKQKPDDPDLGKWSKWAAGIGGLKIK